MGSVTWRKRGHRYQVSWRLDDGSQRAKTVDSADEARDLAAEKRLELRRSTWQGRRRGRLPFGRWADEWWELYSTDPDRSPNTLAITESRLRLHVRPWFGDRPIELIGPADVRRWQRDLAAKVGPATLGQCRSLALRIFQFALDEGAIDTNPVRKVPTPKRRADPDLVLRPGKRRALTPEEAGQLLACFPLFWWDHVITLLGTGLRIGELAGLHRRRVHLAQPIPTVQVVDVRYQAGSHFGSGFKPRPKSDASIRQIPLAPQVVEAIRRRLPPGSDPAALLFTGPGGGPGHRGSPGVKKGTRTMLSRHNVRRTYTAPSPSSLTRPPLDSGRPPPASLGPSATTAPSPPTSSRPSSAPRVAPPPWPPSTVLWPSWLQPAPPPSTPRPSGGRSGQPPNIPCWRRLTCMAPMTSATPSRPGWRTPASRPGVIDELMGHQASGRAGRHRGSTIGAPTGTPPPRWRPA
jgi:integrase